MGNINHRDHKEITEFTKESQLLLKRLIQIKYFRLSKLFVIKLIM